MVSEVSGNMGPSHDTATGVPLESEDSLTERAKVSWKKILGLIGYFDLDPNRALDIVLDLFIPHVSTHHAFFIALLRQSPWCRCVTRNPEFKSLDSIYFKIDDKSSGGGEEQSAESDVTVAFTGRIFESRLQSEEEFLGEDGDGSPLCAQIIGFKFSHYQASIPPYIYLHDHKNFV